MLPWRRKWTTRSTGSLSWKTSPPNGKRPAKSWRMLWICCWRRCEPPGGRSYLYAANLTAPLSAPQPYSVAVKLDQDKTYKHLNTASGAEGGCDVHPDRFLDRVEVFPEWPAVVQPLENGRVQIPDSPQREVHPRQSSDYHRVVAGPRAGTVTLSAGRHESRVRPIPSRIAAAQPGIRGAELAG